MGAAYIVTFDPTITFGAILNAAVILIGFVVAFTRIGGRIDLLTQRIISIEENLRNNRDVSERLAVIETRQGTHGQMIVNLQNDYGDLKKGRGFVQNRSEGGVNGEYP